MFPGNDPWQAVLDFWFDDGLENGWPSANMNRLWFNAGPGQDAEIEHRFGTLVEAALYRELVDWEPFAPSRLALVVVLDQFCRHIFRGTAQAFAGDHRAATLVVEGLSRGMDRQLPWVGRVFFYVPLMHAEDLDLQEMGVKRFRELEDQAPDALTEKIAGHRRFAEEHCEIIRRFGRFPHRNRLLGRENTEEEAHYLENAPRYGQ